MQSDRSMPRHVVVVGLMGAGKSAVGRRLAGRLGWRWRDSDREIESAMGLTVRELRDRDGVDAMHALEADQLLGALAEPGPSVISAAASTVDEPECRDAMTAPDVSVIWLRASPRVLARRFASLHPIVIDVDAISPDKAAAQAMEALR
jgi:shikimate kinase